MSKQDRKREQLKEIDEILAEKDESKSKKAHHIHKRARKREHIKEIDEILAETDGSNSNKNHHPQFYAHWSDGISIAVGITMMVCYGRHQELLFLVTGLACFSTLFTELFGHITSWVLAVCSYILFVFNGEQFIDIITPLSNLHYTGYAVLGVGILISIVTSSYKMRGDSSNVFGKVASCYITSYGLMIIGAMFFASDPRIILPALIILLTCANLIISTAVAVVKSSFILYH